jgi:hypothetical protein
MLMGALILLCRHVRSAEAAQLKRVRFGEHKTFTRIVFDFQKPVLFKEPVIKGRGEFSIVFFDSTTTVAMPFQKLRRRTKQVYAINFTRQESHLTANIKLYSPYFKIKSFPLFTPDRVVVDIYWVSAPSKCFVPKKLVQKKPVQQKPPERVLTQHVEHVADGKSLSSFSRYDKL